MSEIRTSPRVAAGSLEPASEPMFELACRIGERVTVTGLATERTGFIVNGWVYVNAGSGRAEHVRFRPGRGEADAG